MDGIFDLPCHWEADSPVPRRAARMLPAVPMALAADPMALAADPMALAAPVPLSSDGMDP
jgi:hypothetical protein